jgi:hypothetical protein
MKFIHSDYFAVDLGAGTFDGVIVDHPYKDRSGITKYTLARSAAQSGIACRPHRRPSQPPTVFSLWQPGYLTRDRAKKRSSRVQAAIDHRATGARPPRPRGNRR